MNRLSVIGIGPGDRDGMTIRADEVLADADVIVGYTRYIELVRPLYPGKRFFDTPMLQEVDRCRTALELAAEGETVAVVCSGDSGVYGMAGLLYEVSTDFPDVEIEVISGVTAALSGASLLGAPLTHDFVVISLSDLLTPWTLIEKRLEYAAMGDFAICIYNPSSHKRHDYLKRACDILLRHAREDTVCGIARNIGRTGESTSVMTLGQLRKAEVDMFATVYVGNSQTKVIDGNMVTPRGYFHV